MSRLEFTIGPDPGQYLPWKKNLHIQRAATLHCPDCGNGMSISRNHTIGDDGTVSPSIVCPHEPCEFHDFGDFVDWPDTSLSDTPKQEADNG